MEGKNYGSYKGRPLPGDVDVSAIGCLQGRRGKKADTFEGKGGLSPETRRGSSASPWRRGRRGSSGCRESRSRSAWFPGDVPAGGKKNVNMKNACRWTESIPFLNVVYGYEQDGNGCVCAQMCPLGRNKIRPFVCSKCSKTIVGSHTCTYSTAVDTPDLNKKKCKPCFPNGRDCLFREGSRMRLKKLNNYPLEPSGNSRKALYTIPSQDASQTIYTNE